MKAKRCKVIVLVGVLLSQPLLALTLPSASAHGALDSSTHDHSSHDHSSYDHSSDDHAPIQHDTVPVVLDNHHHAVDAHSGAEHAHHGSTKTISTHDCGPCLNGDMNHCQCSAIMEIDLLFVFRNHCQLAFSGFYRSILAAHRQSFFRPPIFA